MALFRQELSETYQWGIWKQEEDVDMLLSKLPTEGRDEYLQGIEKFTSDSRRQEWLAIRVLLFELLGEMKSISYKPSGKPYFTDCSAYLSISHTKGYVAVIVSKSREVGIDIEQRRDRVLKVAHKYVREDERSFFFPDDEVTSLLLIWSAKEVMFKCLDESEIDFREHLYVQLPTEQKDAYMSCSEFRTQSTHHFRIHFLIHPDFVMTWTIRN